MTTDITELAQREKFEAWAEEVGALPWGILKKHRNQDGSYPGPHYTYMWKAWQAASAELVEALEKARQRITQLESRTVTVKLPENIVDKVCFTAAEIHAQGSGVSDDKAQDIIDRIREILTPEAGIKWEAE